jgi:hypothetical protein
MGKMVQRRQSGHLEPFGRQRRKLLGWGIGGLMALAFPFPKWCRASFSDDIYPTISAIPKLEALDKPLLVFRGFENDPDMEIKARIFHDLAQDRDLVLKLKERIGFKKNLSMQVESLDIRLLFVPELRQKYVDAYELYCRSVLDFVFAQLQVPNFYTNIVTPREAYPPIPEKGVTAFLVHQLGKEYRAKCRFTAEDGTSVRYMLKGAVMSGNVGAVDVEIKNPQEGDFQVSRRNYSIWQNHAKNVYTLLQVPVEETCHYILGRYTDKKVNADLKRHQALKVAEVQHTADQWIAVEEAAVGGLVHALLAEYASKNALPISAVDVQGALEVKKNLPQYKFREPGIRLVEELGLRQALDMYKADPAEFQRRLAQI